MSEKIKTENKIWEEVLNNLELNLSKPNFNTWFKDTYFLKYENGKIFISVPNEFVKNWLFEKYSKHILQILRTLKEDVRGVEYIIDNSQIKNTYTKKIFKETTGNKQLSLEDFSINKKDNLNPRYTFDSFVVGTFNELAYAASQAILTKQGVVYNPLFVYGKTGYGKTHLIQAVGNDFKKQDKKVFYTTSEKFSMDCIQSIQQNKVNLFKEKYRKYDILIMDDIQFLTKKERTQEELFHLFNYLYENNKQIIFSSDRHPNHIPDIADRLKSRFSAGMTVDIQVPDTESRAAIIKSRTKMHNFYLKEDVVNYIASEIKGNIRELEGVFNSIMCQSHLKNKELSLPEVKNLIKSNISSKKQITVKELVKTVANFYNIDSEIIYKKTRKREVVKPRQLIMYLLREDFNVSYPSIGEKLGGRDHTTVIHSCEKVRKNLKNNSLLMQELEQIRSIYS